MFIANEIATAYALEAQSPHWADPGRAIQIVTVGSFARNLPPPKCQASVQIVQMMLPSSTMTAKASISLTDSQEAFARELVARGKYSSLSAVLQHGLEMLRAETEAKDAELAALKSLLEERARGPFISMEEGRRRTEEMIARKRAALTRKRNAV